MTQRGDGTRPTPTEIRDQVDAMQPRTNTDGSINATYVAIEQTLRQSHGHPSYIAELDGPGRFRPAHDRYAQCDGTCTVDCGACKGAGRPAEPTAAERVIGNQLARSYGLLRHRDRLAKSIAEALAAVRADGGQRAAAAEERGRESVGLGDFLPDPCGDEYSSYPWYIAQTYGDYVTCTLRRGHDGKHEHSDSGMTWSTR